MFRKFLEIDIQPAGCTCDRFPFHHDKTHLLPRVQDGHFKHPWPWCRRGSCWFLARCRGAVWHASFGCGDMAFDWNYHELSIQNVAILVTFELRSLGKNVFYCAGYILFFSRLRHWFVFSKKLGLDSVDLLL